MPKYLLEAKYTPDGVRGVAEKGGSARREAIEQLIEGVDGTLEAFYFALGETDVYVLADLPGNEAATAVALSVNQSGSASVKTVALLTPEEVDSAAKTSVDYRAPGS